MVKKHSTIKQPITKGVSKVPVVMQLENLECGAACLSMICAYYGLWLPLETIREDCGVSRDGSSAKNMLLAARKYGFEAKGYRVDTEILRKEGSFPCIIHWGYNHFVVLKGFRRDKAYLNDPARGNYSIPLSVFEENYTGIALLMTPGESFTPKGKPKGMLSYARSRLKGSGVALAFSILTFVITSLIGIINPAFSRVFMDYLLTNTNSDWMVMFFILLAAFNVIQIIMSAVNAIYQLRITGKMAAVGNSTFMWKVLNLPLNFFSQRMAADIQGRQSTNATIASTLINTFAPLVINIGMMLFYFFVMLRYSLLLTAVGLASIAINSFVSQSISKKRVNIMRIAMRDSAMLSSTTVSGIQMIETIKSSGAENGFFAKWSGYQASVNSKNISNLKLNAYLGMLPSLVSTLANDIVMILGIGLAMKGHMTIGMIYAFQGLLASFVAPAMSLVEAGQSVQEMRTNMERVEDVMKYKDEKLLAEDTDQANRKLSGRIEVKNVSFGYSPLGDPVIKDFNLSVTPGRTIAIVGGSGCGKSTMSKLLSGLYKPWSGEILLDGKPLCEIEKNVFRASLAVVDQDIILFEDTIANNIKMWDSSIEDFEMILAARDAQIHDTIMERPKGYEHKLIDGGRDFSGGQRQRLEIARVLAQDPTILIMDEATSALDAKTEYEVVKAVRDRGITCIVIAHRLSTIRTCDEIIVMQNGDIVNRGTHKELMETCEIYQNLVASE